MRSACETHSLELPAQVAIGTRELVRTRTRCWTSELPRDPEHPSDEPRTESVPKILRARGLESEPLQQLQLITVVEFEDPIVPPRVESIPTLQQRGEPGL